MKKYILIISLAIWSLHGCQTTEEGMVMTVLGPVNCSEIGTTLTHEHLLVDFIGADSTGYHRWDRDSVMNKVIPFLNEARELGVQTFVECTPAWLGRDPLLLKSISEKTGIHIITNTGYYGAQNNKFIPETFYEMTPEEISSIWIDEFKNGIEGTGIRPGFIKIAVDRNDTLSPEHQKIVTAAALAHRETGLVIASHTGPDAPAFAQIDILKAHGVDPSAFIWVHAQRGSIEGNIRAAQMGAWVSLDNVNTKRDKNPGAEFSTTWYADRLARLKEEGLLHRVLVSHDAGWYRPGEKNGGDFRGFTDVFTTLIPALIERGFTEKEIDQIFTANPAAAFCNKKK